MRLQCNNLSSRIPSGASAHSSATLSFLWMSSTVFVVACLSRGRYISVDRKMPFSHFWPRVFSLMGRWFSRMSPAFAMLKSEEHTSELQSQFHLLFPLFPFN